MGLIFLSHPHFSRWTITALRRLACCSVWLSSISSLLGKVVIRTNSLAAMAGRAATTKCRRSDTLRDTRTRQDRKEGLYDRMKSDNVSFYSLTGLISPSSIIQAGSTDQAKCCLQTRVPQFVYLFLSLFFKNMVCIGVKSQCVGFMRQGFTDLQPPKPCVPNKTLETTQCLCLNNHKDWLHNWDQISTDLVLFISTSSRNTCNLNFFYLWVWLNFWTSLPPSASLI